MDENGERKRVTISEHVKDLCQQQVSREDQLRFKLKIDGDQLDDLISYNQLMEYLEDKTDTGPLEDGFYRFKCIKDHKGPYTSDRFPSTTPGAEPPRDARDSGSARSHSTHLETSSSNRP